MARSAAVRRPGFRTWLRERRIAAGYTQESLAEEIDVSQSAITNWEREGLETMTPTTIRRLATALRVEPYEVAEALGYPTKGRLVITSPLPLEEMIDAGADLSHRIDRVVDEWLRETFQPSESTRRPRTDAPTQLSARNAPDSDSDERVSRHGVRS